MTYRDLLTYIYSLGRFGMKPGLERIRTLLNRLSNPEKRLNVIHLAGTNGKGSTAAFLSAILTSGGYRVGLFSSPHLIHFTERFRINGVEITESDVVSVAERVIAAAPPGTTFFELATAMAYLYFAEEKVDAAIMEVGMGGRLDATNVASGLLSIITPIALDHCEYLGETISLVAGEKGGIIKPGRPVVTSVQSPEALAVINDLSGLLHSPLFCFGKDFFSFWQEGRLDYSGLNWIMHGLKPGIGGRYQMVNAASALFAAELLSASGLGVDQGAARVGVEAAFWPGRMELLTVPERILLDGAHNPAGAAALAEALLEVPHERLILVAGIMESKDVQGILDSLLPLVDQVITVSPCIPRAFSSEKLASLCRTAGVNVIDGGSVAEGLEIALRMAESRDLILVCGSLYTAGEARALLLSEKFEPFRG